MLFMSHGGINVNLKEVEYALEDLEQLLKWVNKDCSIAGFLDLVASANTIRIALEKEIPKKVEKVVETEHSMLYVCPSCGKHEYESKIGNYCRRCGQRLKLDN